MEVPGVITTIVRPDGREDLAICKINCTIFELFEAG